MRSVRNPFALATLLILALGLSACPPSTDEGDPAAADAEAFAALQAAKADLDAKRRELRDLRDQVAGGGEKEASEEEASEEEASEDGGEGGDGAQSPEDRLAALEAEVTAMTEAFTNQVIEYINSQDLYEGEPLTETQRAAFDMKAREDVVVAQEYIEKAGNYQKAIDIYTTSLIADPDSEILEQARAEAEVLRYMTEDRFAAAKKGMTEAEVRGALGTPQPINVREYENGVTAWFYPKAQRKAAAAVYFKQEHGELKVYSVDFNAVEGEEEGWPRPRIEDESYADAGDVRQALDFLSKLPAACNRSRARAATDGTITIRIICADSNNAMDGHVKIKNGVVTDVR